MHKVIFGIATLLISNLGLAMVYGESGRLDTYDAYTSHEASAKRLADILFNSLVEISGGGEYTPSLASKWSIGSDRTYVIFDLRPGVKWHPYKEQKKELTADDVVTTVRLITAEESEVPNKERFSAIERAEKLGKLKVKISLKRSVIDPLRMMMFKILPAHVLRSSPALRRDSEFARKPVGTGAYVFVRSNPQGEILLERNDDFFGKKAHMPRVVMKSYADQSVMAQSLMFNSLDLVTYVSPRDLGEVIGDKRLGVVPYDALSFSFFALNTSRGPLRDKRVRQAISYAVNRQEMLSAFFLGKGQLISGPFPPTSWAYNLDVKPMGYDVERAKRLLKEAGYSDRNGDGTVEDKAGKAFKPVFIVPLAGESEMIKRIVLAFQMYLAKIGVEVDLQFMDWLIWKKRVLGSHDFDITIASWSFDDAANITSLFHSSSAEPWGNNFVLFKDSKVDALLNEADATNDFDKKRAIYHKLHALIADEVPYTFLWTLRHHAAHSVKLKNVQIEPFSFFKHVAQWDLDKKN